MVNVNDIKGITTADKDKLSMIFDRQQELMEKYLDIEKASGIGLGLLGLKMHELPVNLDHPVSQYVLKDFMWRILEELGECDEAYQQEHFDHAREELADAIHFAVDLMLLCGITAEEFGPWDQIFPTHDEWFQDLLLRAFSAFTLAGNCLKNKPWKQTHMTTDKEKFLGLVKTGFLVILEIADSLQMSPDDVFQIYFKKSDVNKFRQRSNY